MLQKRKIKISKVVEVLNNDSRVTVRVKRLDKKLKINYLYLPKFNICKFVKP